MEGPNYMGQLLEPADFSLKVLPPPPRTPDSDHQDERVIPEEFLSGEKVDDPMGPLGPWATGRTDWSPLAGMTGTRPAVTKYSITRFSPAEWRMSNEDVLRRSHNAFDKSIIVENQNKKTIVQAFGISDKIQGDSTLRLQVRAKEIDNWKELLEAGAKAMIEEIDLLEVQRLRLKQSLMILKLPESIANECIDRRCVRPESELVRDLPEEELMKEIALIAEIRSILCTTLNDILVQQRENRSLQAKLEFDWGDKIYAHTLEAVNCSVKNATASNMFHIGCTRLMNDQSSEEYYKQFTQQTLESAEACRQSSIALRATMDAILLNAARDLRTQADRIDAALAERIANYDDVRQKLENELRATLDRLAATENEIERIKEALLSIEFPMKAVQTRLDSRNTRPRVENCRDEVQLSLIREVRSIHDSTTAIQEQLKEAEKMKNELMLTRSLLEREIMFKRQAMQIDKERCCIIREHFPSATALSGY